MPGSDRFSLSSLALAGLLAFLAVTVALIGGVLPGTHILVASLGAGVFLVFALRGILRRHRLLMDGFAVLTLIAAALTLLQAAPLGLALVDALGGPTADRVLRSVVEVGVPNPYWALSADPPASAREAVNLLLCVLVLVVAASLSGRKQHARWILLGVALLGLAEAALGVWSWVTGARDLLGLYASPTTVRGGFLTTLLNPNHAAGLLNLATFAFVSLAIETESRRQRALFGLGAVVTAAGGIATLSRAGGAILLALALALPMAVAILRPGDTPRPARPMIRAFRAILLAATGVVVILGFEELLQQLGQGSLMPEQWRTKAGPWGPVLSLMGDHPLAGIGRGAFATAFAAYNDFAPDFTFEYAENGLLQALADWGVVPGLAIAFAFAFLVGRLVLRSSRRPADLAAAFGVLAVAAQNLVDFSLEIPGVALPFAAVTGVLIRRTAVSLPALDRTERIRTVARLSVLALLAALAIPLASWAGRNDRQEAEGRMEAAFSDEADSSTAMAATEVRLREEVRLHPVDARIPWWGGRQALAQGRLERAEALFRLSLVLFPGSLPARLTLATLDAALGRREDAVAQFRSALEAHPSKRAEIGRAADAAALQPADVLDVYAGRDEDLEALLQRLHRERRFPRLLVLLEARLADRPEDPDLLERLARTYLDAAQPDRAEPLATRLLAQNPDRTGGWYLQGRLFWADDRHLEALAMFREAEQRGGDADAGLWVARCLVLLRRWDDVDAEVAQLWPKVAKDRYLTALVHQLLASKAGSLGNFARAFEELDRADQTFPNLPATALQRAFLLREAGRHTEAVRAFEQALRLDPGASTARKALDESRAEDGAKRRDPEMP
jgi:tetratricopeptide (TPR) repeat protein